MMRAIAALLLLSACAHRPEPEVRTVTIVKPVAVPCIDHVPERPAGLGTIPADADAALSRALQRLLEWKTYGEEADAKLRACAALPR